VTSALQAGQSHHVRTAPGPGPGAGARGEPVGPCAGTSSPRFATGPSRAKRGGEPLTAWSRCDDDAWFTMPAHHAGVQAPRRSQLPARISGGRSPALRLIPTGRSQQASACYLQESEARCSARTG